MCPLRWEAQIGNSLEDCRPASRGHVAIKKNRDPVSNKVEGEEQYPRPSPVSCMLTVALPGLVLSFGQAHPVRTSCTIQHSTFPLWLQSSSTLCYSSIIYDGTFTGSSCASLWLPACMGTWKVWELGFEHSSIGSWSQVSPSGADMVNFPTVLACPQSWSWRMDLVGM